MCNVIILLALCFKPIVNAVKFVDFDANSILVPVERRYGFSFNESDVPLLLPSSETYVGQSVYGGFVTAKDQGGLGASLTASDQTHSGLKIHWEENEGNSGDIASGMFLFKKENFLKMSDREAVSMTEPGTALSGVASFLDPGGIKRASIRLVLEDSNGWHISQFIPLQSSMPFSLVASSLSFQIFDPSSTSEKWVGDIGPPGAHPTFEDITWIGIRIDAIRGSDTWKSADAGVLLLTAHGDNDHTIAASSSSKYIPGPFDSLNHSSGTPTLIDASHMFQKMDGFGSTIAFNMEKLVQHSKANELVDLLFHDLNIDILRIRNCYLSSDEDGGYEDDVMNTVSLIKMAELSLSRPIKILLTGWTAPNFIKSNNSKNGGTILYDPNNIMDYHYLEFSRYWVDSIEHYNSFDVEIEYISIQNEPNREASHPSMILEPFPHDRIAGYNMAVEGVWQEIFNSEKDLKMPKIIGPETVAFDNEVNGKTSLLADYIENFITPNRIYGYAHHLYQDGVGNDPDALNEKMLHFNDRFGPKPIFMTEYYFKNGSGSSWSRIYNLAKLMHNALTLEEVTAYLYWGLYWHEDGGLINFSDDSTYIISPEYYAFKHFSAFIKSDWVRIKAETEEPGVFLSAYLSPKGHKLTVVILNSNPHLVTLDMGFDNISIKSGDIFQSTHNINCKKIGLYNPLVPLQIDAESVTTLSLDALFHM